MSLAVADELGVWCGSCGQPAQKSTDCPDVALECRRCGPITEVCR